MMRLTTADLKDALVNGSVLPYRVALALAATLYAFLIALAVLFPSKSPMTSFVLMGGYGHIWAMIFGTDALALWWRLVDDSTINHARKRIWAVLINVVTMALWGTITIAVAWTGPVISPGITGYVVLTLMALHALWRTEYTWRDRVTL